MAGQKIRIKLKAYDHNLIDLSAERLSRQSRKLERRFRVPFLFPRKRKSSRFCVLLTNTKTAANNLNSELTSV